MNIKVIASGSSGNCYVIESNNQMILLDFGIKWKDILKGIDYQVFNVEGALLSHLHLDHSKAYKELSMYGIPIYTNKATAEHFNSPYVEMIDVPEMKRIKISNFKVVPFKLPHTTKDRETGEVIPCENFGYYIECGNERLAYLTDFEYCPFVLKSLKINHFLVECNHMDSLMDANAVKYEHSLRGHSSLGTVKEFLKVNKTDDLKTVILCHLSRDSADEDEMIKQVQEIVGDSVLVQIAQKGLNIHLSD